MAGLKVAVVVMAVLILAGVTVIAVTLARRMTGTPQPTGQVQATLDEPAGTHIAGVATSADRLTLRLQGGGPDRVVVLDLRSGHVVARAALAH